MLLLYWDWKTDIPIAFFPFFSESKTCNASSVDQTISKHTTLMSELNAYNLSWETEGLHDNDELKMEKLFVFHIQTTLSKRSMFTRICEILHLLYELKMLCMSGQYDTS